MTSRELDKMLREAGWQAVKKRGKGSHRAYIHPEQKGTIIVPWHRGKNLKTGLVRRILTDSETGKYQ